MVGRGGVPPSPDEPLSPETVWVDWATVKPPTPSKSSPSLKVKQGTLTQPQAQAISHQPPPAIVEAQTWVRNAKGEIYLVAAAPNYHHTSPMSPTCK
jgi:large exoprotein involved in heme utilization and adhesion